MSPVAIITPAAAAADADRLDNRPQHVDLETFLEDERERQTQRLCASGGEVVDRPVHGERSDVAAREEQRADDVGIGREGDASRSETRERQDGAVFLDRQPCAAERRKNHPVDEPVARFATAAVTERDALVAQRLAQPPRDAGAIEAIDLRRQR